MWLLQNDEKGLAYRVSSHKPNIVSRKDGDLLLVGDQSISRKHAQLVVGDENKNDGIVLKDLQSKYGTFTSIGNEEFTQLPPNQQITLKSGDFVRFGVQWNRWRVEYVNLLVATSTLTQEEKVEVKQLVTGLGGQVVGDWQQECSHLTMNKLTVTVKVVCALAACQPIVTPAYWKSFAEALSSQSTLPNCKDFTPVLAEAVLNPSEVSFAPNSARSKLFNGYTFIASSLKQLNRIKSMVTTAGGNAVQFSAKVWTETKFLTDKTILMQHSGNEKRGSQNSQVLNGYLTMARNLRAKGIRCIPESEIGLGVLYCSMKQYCNPRYSATSVLGSSSSVEATQPVTIICPDTEESTSSSKDQSDDISFSRSPEQRTLEKRSHEVLNNHEIQTKKKADIRGSNEDEIQTQKNAALRGESLDLFESQISNIQKPESSNKLDMHVKKTTSKTSKISSEAKAPNINSNTSLDMFASSGKHSSTNNKDNVRSSSMDIFAPSGSQSPKNKKKDEGNEFSFISKKRNRPEGETEDGGEFDFIPKKSNVVQQEKEVVEEFSFIRNKRSRPQKESGDADEFALAPKKSKYQEQEMVDEFSFSSKKHCRLPKESENGSEFSFLSDKRPTKSIKNSNTDIFGSSNESTIIKEVIPGPSNKNFSKGTKQSTLKDTSFDFPGTSKRKRNNESIGYGDECGSNIKIAFFSKHEDSISNNSILQTQVESVIVKQIEEPKSLITYSKLNPPSIAIKKDKEDTEIDELAKELHNTTIVVVKPLVHQRPKCVETSTVTSGGKNFKKFRKVPGLYKRAVPHIIGGSDLVAYKEGIDSSEDLLPDVSSHHTTLVDDDWTFPNNRNKRKAH